MAQTVYIYSTKFHILLLLWLQEEQGRTARSGDKQAEMILRFLIWVMGQPETSEEAKALVRALLPPALAPTCIPPT